MSLTALHAPTYLSRISRNNAKPLQGLRCSNSKCNRRSLQPISRKICIKIETSLSYHKENILYLANSMSPNLHTFLCKQYHRHWQMHSAATMKKADGIQLNCQVLFSEWVGFGHTSTKNTYSVQMFLGINTYKVV